jgi:RNA polymerase sigma-70 factor (ECF subfamily)
MDTGATPSLARNSATVAYVAAARAAWPMLEVDAVSFDRYLAQRAPVAGRLPPVAHAGDLLLAFACATGVPGAVATFRATFDGVLARVLARRRASASDAADIKQTVYERLLVAAPGAAPRIAEYRGDGPLRSWVSTSVATTLLMMQRAAGRRRERSNAAAEVAAVAQADPEILHLKRRYRVHIEAAVVRALGRLGQRERTLLNLHLSEGLTIDHLGAMYRVNRATAARWLSAARDALVDHARGEIRSDLRVSESECDSLVALVRSDLDVSIARHLGSGS